MSENCAWAPPVTCPLALYVSLVCVAPVTIFGSVVAIPTLAISPVRFPVNVAAVPVTCDGCAQLAAPLAAMPRAKLTPEHAEGVAANAVAVPAFWVVLWFHIGTVPVNPL